MPSIVLLNQSLDSIYDLRAAAGACFAAIISPVIRRSERVRAKRGREGESEQERLWKHLLRHLLVVDDSFTEQGSLLSVAGSASLISLRPLVVSVQFPE